MMDVLSVISQGCTNITATSSPGITNIGVLLTQSLGTSLIVYEGVMESINSATGRGFDFAKFARTVFIVMVTLAFVEYYDSTIPGMNYSLKTVISQGNSKPCPSHRQQFIANDDERHHERAVERTSPRTS